MTATLSRPMAPLASSRGLPARTLLGRETDPVWARPALWGTLLLAALLYTWNLSANGDANTYYSAAVYSGTQSWKAFFFGAIDAGSYITVDKPPMALWVMGLSARIFGYNTASLLLPQAIAGVATVGVLYTAVRRSFGHGAATIAALVLALTPMTVAINRDNNPDTLLVLLLTLAAWACLTAMRNGRLLPLLGSAFFIGCAFNTKMLQGYVLLPVLAGVYLLFSEGGLVRRLRNLAAAGVVLVVSSGWWMVIVDLIPASDRPYVGGSENNTVWDLVIGYNGLGRIFGENGGGGGGGGGANFGGAAGVGRLFNSIVGGQISWLIPAAAIALVAGVLLIGRAPRTDARRAALLIWGGWLAIHYVVFSFAEGTFHPYYVTALAPAIGALVGAGSVLLWQAPRRVAWLLPLSVAVTGGWAFTLLRRTPTWNPWVAWVVLAATVVAVIALLVVRFAPRAARPLVIVAVVAALVSGLAGPTAFAASAAGSKVNGSNPTAGPSTGGGFGGPGGAPGGARDGQRQDGGGAPPNMPAGGFADGGAGGNGGGRGGPGGNIDTAMIQYLEKNQGDATWLVAVSSAQAAGSMILQTHKAVIAMGGFTGSDPAMTVDKLKSYVASGELKYIVIGGDNRGGSANSDVTAWVKTNGTVVDATEYGGTASSTQVLYKLG